MMWINNLQDVHRVNTQQSSQDTFLTRIIERGGKFTLNTFLLEPTWSVVIEYVLEPDP